MSRLRDSIYGVLKGKFLISDDSIGNWRFILFVVALMLIMISSAHKSDRKVMEIARLNKDVHELRAQFLDLRAISMKKKLESAVRKSVVGLGLRSSKTPPQVIKVISKK